ncbi:AI-2E family transporter [Roseateles violae]|uniref:AI-2E family transporter n=1 Tax=Roseateles violae TaxID=3058042 RepID=A0ABT8DLQ1_9BURK|nr:AI-2E family transporter [Pelomonas sp. PFR6]MDN3919330.1 AI-2E family transporter [Pelomonas sp. PFR6]
MNEHSAYRPNLELETRLSKRLLDVLIRAGLLVVLVTLCYRIFSPFIALMSWALVLAVTLYPAQQWLARRLGGRSGLSSTLLVLLIVVVLVLPTAVLMSSVADSVHLLLAELQQNTLQIPPPHASVAGWPLVGDKLYALWELAHNDLPAAIASLQPKIGNLAKTALALVAGVAGAVLSFLASVIIAGVFMAYGDAGERRGRSIFNRIVGGRRGDEFAQLCSATIRAVALGVVGVALIQAIVAGLVLLVAGVPFAGVLAALVLVLAIAQLPALLITLPAIAYIWWSGMHGTALAVVYTALLLLVGVIDNVLKPLLLGRGVDAPMPVILLGAIGGLAGAGILGMFVGAVLLALGYQVLIWWVDSNPDLEVVTELPPAPLQPPE